MWYPVWGWGGEAGEIRRLQQAKFFYPLPPAKASQPTMGFNFASKNGWRFCSSKFEEKRAVGVAGKEDRIWHPSPLDPPSHILATPLWTGLGCRKAVPDPLRSKEPQESLRKATSFFVSFYPVVLYPVLQETFQKIHVGSPQPANQGRGTLLAFQPSSSCMCLWQPSVGCLKTPEAANVRRTSCSRATVRCRQRLIF